MFSLVLASLVRVTRLLGALRAIPAPLVPGVVRNVPSVRRVVTAVIQVLTRVTRAQQVLFNLNLVSCRALLVLKATTAPLVPLSRRNAQRRLPVRRLLLLRVLARRVTIAQKVRVQVRLVLRVTTAHLGLARLSTAAQVTIVQRVLLQRYFVARVATALRYPPLSSAVARVSTVHIPPHPRRRVLLVTTALTVRPIRSLVARTLGVIRVQVLVFPLLLALQLPLTIN